MNTRRKTEIWIALAVLTAGLSLSAETVARTKLYFCPKTDTPPVIDGRVDDSCWKLASPMSDFGFLRFGDQKGQAPKTTVKALHDNECLYLSFNCDEPDMDRFRKLLDQTSAVYARDCIECYIDTRNDKKGYVCFDMNAKNESFSEAKVDMGWLVVTDNSFNLWVRWECRGATRKDGWSIEAKINWQDLKVIPKDGTVMGFNPCRFRFTAEPAQYLCWSTVGGWQKTPADFGHMVLGDPPDDIETILKAIYPVYRNMTIEMPTGNGFKKFKDGKMTFLAYREILSTHLDGIDRQVEDIEGMPGAKKQLDKKHLEKLSASKEKLAVLRKSIADDAGISEGMCVGTLKAIDQLRSELSDLRWQAERDELLSRFARQVGG